MDAMAWPLEEIAAALSGSLHGAADVRVTGVSIDSRRVAAGDLFIALAGPHFDGHDFAAQAADRQAAALLVSRRVDVALPQVVVADTRLALGTLAAAWRQRFSPAVIAVTGSNGKTTVKEMIAAILSRTGKEVLVTQGNLNNDIGLPLTLLRLRAAHHYAVIEMGANHAGEIDYLVRLARPDVALITNAAPAHLAGFGSLDGVARAKGEIYDGLGRDGIAIINGDDHYAALWQRRAAGRTQRLFALQQQADFHASDIVQHHEGYQSFSLHTPQGTCPVRLALPGRHNVMNALAAAAAAQAVAVDLAVIAAGLETMRPVAGRLQPRSGIHGVRIIDDTYNANPASVAAAITVLATFPGRRILILGDMAELGPDARTLHAELGSQAREAGIDALYTVGTLAAAAASAFGAGGQACEDHDTLLTRLGAELAAHTGAQTVLVKGSRTMHMETVVAALAAADGGHHGSAAPFAPVQQQAWGG